MSVGNALETMLAQLPPQNLPGETCPLAAGLGRYLAQNIVSPEAIPPFDRSTMDGYALRADDSRGASPANPIHLDLVGEVQMGRPAATPVEPGQAMTIPTGGMLPPGANAVLMVEDGTRLDDDTIAAAHALAPGANVIKAGEDIGRGDLLLARGHRLRPQDLGALAALGLGELSVYRPLTVGILSTGNEIVDVDQTPAAGQIRDINYYALAACVSQSGAEPLRLGICPDDAGALKERLRSGLTRCQAIIVSGGSSVGAADLTPRVINELGSPGVLVQGVGAKPGKPTIMALIENTPVFGLPGHSVSALDIYRLLVDPMIQYIYGGRAALGRLKPQITARLSRSLASVAGREDRVRVALQRRQGELWAEPISGRAGLISLTLRTDGVAVIPPAALEVRQGAAITVELF